MTEAEKLEALVQKAIDRGWSHPLFKDGVSISANESDISIGYEDATSEYVMDVWNIKEILFNHDFSEFLWGSKSYCHMARLSGDNVVGKVRVIPLWQYHLQQAVISADPIDYMYRAVFDQ